MLISYRFFMGVAFCSILPYYLMAQEGNDSEPVKQLIQENQELQAKTEKIDRVITGEIVFIEPPYDSYCKPTPDVERIMSEIATQVFKNDGYEIEVAPGEIKLRVGVRYKYAELSEEDRKMISDDDWPYRHPRLQGDLSLLPLHLFLDEKEELKDEGEEVIIYYNDKQTHERIKVVLTIRTADIVTQSDLYDSSKVHYIVREEGYRSKMKFFLESLCED